MRHTMTICHIAFLGAVLLWGCGSNLDSSGSSSGSSDGIENAANLGSKNCLTCHGHTPVGVWVESKHAAGGYGGSSSSCLPCHNPTDPFDALGQNVVGCEACHGGGQFHWGPGPILIPTPGPEQCTICHGIAEDLRHDSSLDRIISDTHYDQSLTGLIEGYNVRAEVATGCSECHFDSHNPDPTDIFQQWGRSSHAGQLLSIKEDVAEGGGTVEDVKNAGTDSDAWASRNFHEREDCSRCHTSTGAANYLDDPENYTHAMNDYSHLADDQRELLYCWGCHGAKGAIRNPGAITADYEGATVTYPDIEESNVCMACHIGRESGETIKNSTDDFSDKRFVNSHYLSAGGTIFKETGYEYTGQDYDTGFFIHDEIAKGEGGPCVGCHLQVDDPDDQFNHMFRPFEINETEDGFDYLWDGCLDCHGNEASTFALVDNGYTGYMASLADLETILRNAGYDFQGGFPYFGAVNWLTGADPNVPGDSGIAGTGPNNMGAAFNFNLLLHETGGYTHNKRYVKRLIFDSLDWLLSPRTDDDDLDGIIDEDVLSPETVNYLDSDTGAPGVQRP